MRRSAFFDLVPLVPVGITLVLRASAASADPGPFRRTMPRAFLGHDVGGLIVGIPTGRARGIESGLRPLDGAGPVALAVAVADPDVAEAFVRVAFYARGDVHSGQLATRDSPFVHVGEDRRIVVELDPPPGAVAYRIRVLGRLVAGATLSRADAIRVWSDLGAADQGRPRPALTRLETNLP
ncbi:MAG TPA: hypothetical protein DCK98_07870 [Chloroflexi bacterium]|jgi:hypothetical protein|nr:hypothetical protein [Chloroflexota bacterium]HAL28163.1 hypothetical protein [Chloroflexota bacterium]